MNVIEIDRIIEMAWEDRTSFDAIYKQFNIQEKEVIKIMRSNLKKSSFKLWRKRVNGRKTKHLKVLNNDGIKTLRFKCSRQKNISNNRIT
tara:strand:+ start:2086 stop:2355 length:270 start_codon:yes stop_codon:yes gene_type:complete